MNFDKVLLKEELTEELTHTGLQSENGLVCGNTQIDDPVVKTNVLSYDSHLITTLFGFLRGISVAILSSLVSDFSRSIFELERQDRH